MTYNRPPWPKDLYQKFSRVARILGYLKRGTRWKMLDLLLDYALAHPDVFKAR